MYIIDFINELKFMLPKNCLKEIKMGYCLTLDYARSEQNHGTATFKDWNELLQWLEDNKPIEYVYVSRNDIHSKFLTRKSVVRWSN